MVTFNMSKKLKIVKAKVIIPLKLDLGCGENCQVGFTGVDLYAPSAKVKLDLLAWDLSKGKFAQWPWKDNTVDEIFCSHFVEHIPAHLRWKFFEECWRIMKLGATMRIFAPNWKSERAYGDMTHQWPPFSTMALYYLQRGWREANKLTYGPYDIKCNFDLQAGATAISPAFSDRTPEAQQFAAAHYCESFPDMWAILTKQA
jgi:hypothetical protein